MCEGLGRGVGHHTDPDTSPKHHREPGKPTELRYGVIFSEANSACTRYDGQHEAHDHEDRGRVDIPASEIADRAGLDVHQNRAGIAGERRPKHEADNDDFNGDRHPAVLAGIEPGAINPGDGLWH